jgi:formylglycine-generating enzyme required for sulfatase activity
MVGNVREWCADLRRKSGYYKAGVKITQQVERIAEFHGPVLRGGTFATTVSRSSSISTAFLRVRNPELPFEGMGFRVAKTPT